MDLPIDVRTAPFKRKYLDEETPLLRRWFIFGQRNDGSGVDIRDGQQDVFIGVDHAVAITICMQRDRYLDKLLPLLGAHEVDA